MKKKWQPVDTCFVAVPLPDDVLDFVGRWQRKLGTLTEDVVWEKRDKLHITLAFVGKLSSGEQSTILEGMRNLEPKTYPIELSVGHIDYFYNRHSDSVVWMAVYDSEGVLVDLHKQLVSYLNARGFSLSEKKIVPHVTIGRVKKLHGDEKKALLAKLADVEVDTYVSFEMNELQLLKSNYQKISDSTEFMVLHRLGLAEE